MDLYKCVGDHPIDLTGGQILAPGDYAMIDAQDDHNASLIDDGRLLACGGEVKPPEPVDYGGPAEAVTEPGAEGEAKDETNPDGPAPVEAAQAPAPEADQKNKESQKPAPDDGSKES